MTTLLLLALAVSADAFAVSVGKGLAMRGPDRREALTLAAAFGLAQGVMPVLGWLLGTQLEGPIAAVDHWIAFAILALVGVRMLREAVREPAEDVAVGTLRTRTGWRELTVLAVATSVDALAVGITLALLDVSILGAALLIGATTFALSLVGVAVGRAAGARWRQPAEVLGGVVLVLIGLRILLDHLSA